MEHQEIKKLLETKKGERNKEKWGAGDVAQSEDCVLFLQRTRVSIPESMLGSSQLSVITGPRDPKPLPLDSGGTSTHIHIIKNK